MKGIIFEEICNYYIENGFKLSGRFYANDIQNKLKYTISLDNIIKVCNELIKEDKLIIFDEGIVTSYALSGDIRVNLINKHNLIPYWKVKASKLRFSYLTYYSFEDELNRAKLNFVTEGVDPYKIRVTKQIVFNKIKQNYCKNGSLFSGSLDMYGILNIVGIPYFTKLLTVKCYSEFYIRKYEDIYTSLTKEVEDFVKELVKEKKLVTRTDLRGTTYLLEGSIREDLINYFNLIPKWKKQFGKKDLHTFEEELNCAIENICARDLKKFN